MPRLLRAFILCCLALLLAIPFVRVSLTAAQAGSTGAAELETIASDNVYRIAKLMSLNGEYSAAFTQDGARVFTESFSDIALLDAATGRYVTGWNNDVNVRRLLLNPEGTLLAAMNDDGTISIWDVETKTRLHVLTGHTEPVQDIAFSPDGRLLVSGGRDHTIRFWDVQTGSEQRVIDAGDLAGDVLAVAFSPDGKLLAASDCCTQVTLWDMRTGSATDTLYHVRVEHLAFSPDGSRLAAAGVDGVKLWNVATGAELALLSGNTAAFNPDGRILATTTEEVVWLWDGQTGEQLTFFAGHGSPIWRLVFSPDGKRLASIGWHVVNLWGVPTLDGSPSVKRSGVTVSASGEDALIFTRVIPDKWLATAGQSPHFEIRLVSFHTLVENCQYTVGVLTRRRIDVRTVVIDLDSGQQIASQDFPGGEPALCGPTANLKLTGGNYRDGLPPDSVGFEEWLKETMAAIGLE